MRLLYIPQGGLKVTLQLLELKTLERYQEIHLERLLVHYFNKSSMKFHNAFIIYVGWNILSSLVPTRIISCVSTYVMQNKRFNNSVGNTTVYL